MAIMTPFKYGSFYDVPRSIILSYRDMMFLLLSNFDEDLDDYQTEYSLYVIPAMVQESVRQGSWEFLRNTPMTCIGRIPVHNVLFDSTKRKELDASFLDSWVAAVKPIT